MIVCIENPKQLTEELLDLVGDYSKVAEFKVNVKKSIAFLYTSNEQWIFEIKDTTPFILAQKNENRYNSNKISVRAI